MSVFEEAGHRKNTVVLTFRRIQCLHLRYSEVALVLVSSEAQVQLQMILDPDYILMNFHTSNSLFRMTMFH